jgi:(S)-2-hydroxyglutarate dehydrogenase
MPRTIAVVGGGIVGLTVARLLTHLRPSLHVVLLEKEPRVGSHQTGHNSGVIHSGVYYRPGSLKAELCRRGRAQLLEYARVRGIPVRNCGKVIVATSPEERDRLDELQRRSLANGVPGVRRLDPGELRELEPCARGVAALHVPGTSIVSFSEVARQLALELESRGVDLRTTCRVLRIAPGSAEVVLETSRERIRADFVINAAGLYADRLARSAGADPGVLIVPFRGEYFLLRPERRGWVRGLIYPVPDPALPFLGVHLTPTIDGRIEAGPNAILAFAREGYRKTTLRPSELFETLRYPGVYRLARRFWRSAWHEAVRSLSRQVFLRDLRRMVPDLAEEDLRPGGAGVRAQALRPDGSLVEDFLIVATPRVLHVLNAPSPAATSSFAIAEHLVARVPTSVV